MITRYTIEIEHDALPVDGELIHTTALLNMTMSALVSDEDDIDIGVRGVSVRKEPVE